MFIELDEGIEDIGLVGVKGKEKTANFKLPNNIQEWNHKILKKFHEDYDWVVADNVYIRWQSNFDENEGYGVGVLILERDGMNVSVPIVVKNYELQPMDIYFDPKDEELKPFTEINVEKSFFSTDIAEEVGEPATNKSGRNLMKDVFAPRMGKFTFASADPKIVENMDLTEEQIADFNAKLQDKEVLAYAKENEAFRKKANAILSKTPAEDLDSIEKEKLATALISPDDKVGYELSYFEDDELKVKKASYYDAYKWAENKFGIEKKAFDEKIKQVDEGSSAGLYNIEKLSEVDTDDFQRINKSGKVLTMSPAGEEIEGYALPRVLELRTGQPLDEILIMDRERNIITSQKQVIGKRLNSEESIHDIQRKRVERKPYQGDIITFVFHSRQYNDYVALEPAKLLEYQEIAGEGKLYTVFTGFGMTYNILVGTNIRKADFSMNNKRDAIILPEDASYAILKQEQSNVLNKQAQAERVLTKEASKIEVEYFRGTNEFKIDMNGKIKEATPREALLELMNEGVDHSLATELLEKKASAYFAKSEDKQEEKEKQASFNFEPPTDVVKLAAQTKDIKTMDEILSLNFINDKNLNQLYKMLPEFKETVQNLAALSLASRIGEVGIKESTITDAMKSLQVLVEKMEGYQFEGV